jgi:hypothetical protein
MIRRTTGRALRATASVAALALLAIAIAYAWGGSGHIIINRTAVRHLPPAMAAFKADSMFYANHASDADDRRVTSDTSMFAESPRHYIDIDAYPNFHHIPHAWDSVLAAFGWATVKDYGTNPWTTAWLTDSLADQLRRGDMTKARQTMADLGHYVGDAHQPLHATKNFDGQYTGNNRIHSRYESGMISRYLSNLTVYPDTARYIADPLEFAFQYLYESNSHVDSIMIADTYAKSVTGGVIDSLYYAILWQMTSGFTKEAFQTASVDLASIWYTAWVNAGLGTDVQDALAAIPSEFELRQNYPNPFNPTTTFTLEARSRSRATLEVFDLLGRRVATLLDGEVVPGTHRVTWDAAGSPSGVYLYMFRAGAERRTGKMVLLR